MIRHSLFAAPLLALLLISLAPAEESPSRTYENRLTPIANPEPILGDHPEFVEPIRETARFEGPMLVDDPVADLFRWLPGWEDVLEDLDNALAQWRGEAVKDEVRVGLRDRAARGVGDVGA